MKEILLVGIILYAEMSLDYHTMARDLLNSGIGDVGRLEFILECVKSQKPLYNTDVQFLERHTNMLNQKIEILSKKTKPVNPKKTILSEKLIDDIISKSDDREKQKDTIPSKEIITTRADMTQDHHRNRSWIWFLLPVFAGILGGVISYFAVKTSSLRMAKDCMYIGIATSILPMLLLVSMIIFGISISEFSKIDDCFVSQLQIINNIP